MVYSSTHSLWKGRQYFHGYYMIDHKRFLHMLGVVTSRSPNAHWWGIDAVLCKFKSCVYSSPLRTGIRYDGIVISLRILAMDPNELGAREDYPPRLTL